MSIREKEDELFQEWSAMRPDLVRDGVVDEAQYLASKRKLLFVLKEVNDLDGGDWDLREFICGGARSQTWNNITRWVKGIKHLPEDMEWGSLVEIKEAERKETLTSIATMNLKKSPGSHTADSAKLAEAAHVDRELLRRQFKLYEPDFVICCGSTTSNIFHEIIEFETPPAWKRTNRGIWYHQPVHGRFIIEYAHPGARCAASLLHYGLVDAVRELAG